MSDVQAEDTANLTTLFSDFTSKIETALGKMQERIERQEKATSQAKRDSSVLEEDLVEDDFKEDDLFEEDNTGDTKSLTFPVSEATKAFLQTAFCVPKPADNKVRRAWRSKFGLPEGDETRCPKLDSIIKGELPKEALEADRKLSRFQNFVLDATGPLVAALEELSNSDAPDPSLVTAAVQQSLMFLGNTAAHLSQERRTKALARLNPDLKSLVDDEDFSKAAPFLFGSGFEKKAKERAEALECLRKASNPSTQKSGQPPRKQFFRGSRSQQTGGSGSGYYHRQRDTRPYQRQRQNFRTQSYNSRNGGKKPQQQDNQ